MLGSQTRIVAIIVAACLIPPLIQTSTIRSNQVKACNAGNLGVRAVQWDQLHVGLTIVTQRAEQSADPEVKASYEEAKRGYQKDIDQMVLAASPFAQKQGSYLVDCNKAYPKLFPFNIFS